MMGSEKGSVLVIVITGITIIAAIGAGLAAMVSSGARTGANHSLSVQALYAAESGLEWAGFRLREEEKSVAGSWANFCENEDLIGEDPPPINSASFSIEKTTQILNDDDEPIGCEITVAGWVGSDEDNPLAKREIKGDVPKGFIEASGDNDGIGGDGVTLNDFPIKNGDVVFVKNGTIITTDVNIPNHAEVYFGQNVSVTNVSVTVEVTIKPQGFAYFGDNFSLEGNIEIKGDACLKNDISITGYLKISTGAGELVCIGDNLDVGGNLDVGNSAQVCIGEDPVYNELSQGNQGTICFSDDTSDECTTLCESCTSICEDPEFESVSPNPVGTDEGSWSEG